MGASCDDRCGGDNAADFVPVILSRNELVVMVVVEACDDVDEWRLAVAILALRSDTGGCGEIGGVIDTTISSLSISSSSLLLPASFGEHCDCDLSTASK